LARPKQPGEQPERNEEGETLDDQPQERGDQDEQPARAGEEQERWPPAAEPPEGEAGPLPEPYRPIGRPALGVKRRRQLPRVRHPSGGSVSLLVSWS